MHVFLVLAVNSQKGPYQDRSQCTLLLMRLPPAHAATALAAIVALTACSSATPAVAPVAATATSPSPTPTPTPTPTELGAVVGIAQLRDAALAAGYTCPSWGETNSINKASESGTC